MVIIKVALPNRGHLLIGYLWLLDMWAGFKHGQGESSDLLWTGVNGKPGLVAILVHLMKRQIIDIQRPHAGQTLTVLEDTVFKKQPKQSADLPSDQKMSVREGTTF